MQMIYVNKFIANKLHLPLNTYAPIHVPSIIYGHLLTARIYTMQQFTISSHLDAQDCNSHPLQQQQQQQ